MNDVPENTYENRYICMKEANGTATMTQEAIDFTTPRQCNTNIGSTDYEDEANRNNCRDMGCDKTGTFYCRAKRGFCTGQNKIYTNCPARTSCAINNYTIRNDKGVNNYDIDWDGNPSYYMGTNTPKAQKFCEGNTVPTGNMGGGVEGRRCEKYNISLEDALTRCDELGAKCKGVQKADVGFYQMNSSLSPTTPLRNDANFTTYIK